MARPKAPSPPEHDQWEWAKVVNLDGDAWLVEAHVVLQDGTPVLSSLRVKPSDELPPGGLSGRFLRRIRTGDIVRAASEEWAGVAEGVSLDFGIQSEYAPRPGRAGHPEAHYLEVAVIYAKALADGVRPTKAVGERFGVSTGTASQKIVDARKRGLLSPHPNPRSGMPAGRLTEKAIAMLNEQTEED